MFLILDFMSSPDFSSNCFIKHAIIPIEFELSILINNQYVIVRIVPQLNLFIYYTIARFVFYTE